MKNFIVFVFVLAIVLPMNSYCYDHLQLVQVWSPTYCAQSHVTCVNPLRRNFYIHGLWPANKKGKTLPPPRSTTWIHVYRQVIKPVLEYSLLQDHNLKAQLLRAWHSIRADRGYETPVFWERQWKKHGEGVYPQMAYADYFWAIVAQWHQIDLQTILGNAQISPSENVAYSKDQIQSAVDVAIGQGKEIYISCKTLNSTHALLFEMYICLGGQYAHIYQSCPVRPSSFKGCHPDRTVANILIRP